MNLGILATIAGKQPSNFYHFLLDNECYATTGGQPVPNAKNINYAGMAKEAGYTAAYTFDDLETFGTQVGNILSERGPVFVAIKVIPEVENEPIGRRQRRPTRSRAETIRVLQEELGITGRCSQPGQVRYHPLFSRVVPLFWRGEASPDWHGEGQLSPSNVQSSWKSS
jgi:hypothetical protein